MCLFITSKQRRQGTVSVYDPVVRKAPHIAYKAVWVLGNDFVTPYQDVLVNLGVVYKADIRPDCGAVRAGLHMCLTRPAAHRHTGTVLVALVPPGAEVYYDKYGDEIAVSEAVYFRTRADAKLWWKDNWHKYKDKM